MGWEGVSVELKTDGLVDKGEVGGWSDQIRQMELQVGLHMSGEGVYGCG